MPVYHVMLRQADAPADWVAYVKEDSEDAARRVIARRFPSAEILWVSEITERASRRPLPPSTFRLSEPLASAARADMDEIDAARIAADAPETVWLGRPGPSGKWALLLSEREAIDARAADWEVIAYALGQSSEVIAAARAIYENSITANNDPLAQASLRERRQDLLAALGEALENLDVFGEPGYNERPE